MRLTSEVGHAMVEYVAVCTLVVLAVLWADPDVIDSLVAAWTIRYDAFAARLARP